VGQEENQVYKTLSHAKIPLYPLEGSSVKMRKFVSVGNTFGKLTVVADAGKIKGGKQWLCRCECGNTTTARAGHLHSGSVKSCGCGEGNYKHGHDTKRARSPEYVTWTNMKMRCYNTSNAHYGNYGGRGITIHDSWRNDFAAFFAYVGPRPPACTLDRINNDGNYEPGNVRWAQRRVQTLNKRNTVRVTYKGESRPLMEWCEELGMTYGVANQRINVGWSVEDALTIPIGQRRVKNVKSVML
jgi:hypothetical protein